MEDDKEKTPKVETPTVEEQIADLTSQLAGVKEKATTVEESWKNEQRVSSRKEQEIQRLQDRLNDITSDKEMSQAMMALIASQTGRSEEEVSEEVQARKPDLLKQFKTLEEQRLARRAQDEAKKIGEQYRKRVEALGLTSKDKAYRDIYRDVREGLFDFADAQLAELEAKASDEKPKESEEERQKAIEEEALRLIQEKNPDSLKTDIGGPSAGGEVVSIESVKEAAREPVPKGKKSLEAYQEKADKAFKAWKEGKLK